MIKHVLDVIKHEEFPKYI
jgi:hypothetical protein